MDSQSDCSGTVFEESKYPYSDSGSTNPIELTLGESEYSVFCNYSFS